MSNETFIIFYTLRAVYVKNNKHQVLNIERLGQNGLCLQIRALGDDCVDNLSQLTAFFGWMVVINLLFLTAFTLALVLFRRVFIAMHAYWFHLLESDVLLIYAKFLTYYKLLLVVLFVTPYLALKLVTI